MNQRNNIFKLCLSGILLALAIILPFITLQIPEFGNMLCPMHIPVLLCGFLCGAKYGSIVGLVAPLLRSLIFGMPPLYPTAITMALELMVYGLVSGFCYQILKQKKSIPAIITIYIALILAMICGRVFWGVGSYLLSLIGNIFPFNLSIFISGAFLTAWPGILLHLIFIPVVVFSVEQVNNKNN